MSAQPQSKDEQVIGPRAQAWAKTHRGHGDDRQVLAHADTHARFASAGQQKWTRERREEAEAMLLRPGATLAMGAGNRANDEEADPLRTCFERDHDRIVHSTAFRRLAGKTQVVVYPSDHQRTRLTHALEVAQLATSIARGIGANDVLADAIALGHDCGHGPGGHASEDAFDVFIAEGYDHGPWGADVVLQGLNLCAETLDGIRNHSWSRPAPSTLEGEICSWSDRIAYCAHDLEDAIHAGIVSAADVPAEIVEVVGVDRRSQLSAFVGNIVATTVETGQVGMSPEVAGALAALRAFNYERIYTRPESLAQSSAVVKVLQALVEHYAARPGLMPSDFRIGEDPIREAVTYVGGMTDRFAFDQAIRLLDWNIDELPTAVDRH